MRSSVNLSDFHEMTGGDAALERKLFKDFMKSSAQCLRIMRNSWIEGKEPEWQHQAHAFKGICLNLGATRLGQLCKKAQDSSTAAPAIKLELLKAIETELEAVKSYLEKI